MRWVGGVFVGLRVRGGLSLLCSSCYYVVVVVVVCCKLL